jgi:hypothetical protein
MATRKTVRAIDKRCLLNELRVDCGCVPFAVLIRQSR